MVLHTLAMMGLEMPILRWAALATELADQQIRKVGVVEPSDGMALAIFRMKVDPAANMYLHLDLSAWPGEAGDLSLGGRITSNPTPSENSILPPPLAMIILPLHTILKALVV